MNTAVKYYFSIILMLSMLLPEVMAATLADAKMAIRAQDYNQAVKILKPLASNGNREAQYQLAVMYGNGQGASKDKSKAAHWMTQSAKQGYK
ncbi:MAG: SEL1-like repeat protein, partial [Gammaproteobacteria bacterium]|nr:SEL1-like repeat protein [Gammaproteobacteria bacterium]NNJ50831.1 SEL1-like repeat protein [Gammaproteobacteria bacterium]